MLAAAVVAATVSAAPATASPTLLTRATDLRLGPALAGDALFYGELYRDSVRVTLAEPGRARRPMAHTEVPGSTSDETGEYTTTTSSIAASPERLVFAGSYASGNARYQQGVTGLDRLAGDFAGLDTLERCSSDTPYGPASTAVDADGARIATTDCAGRIEIRSNTDFPDDIVRVDPGPRLAVGTLALAGRYVAYNAYGLGPGSVTPTTTVVHDWVAGTNVYEIPRQSSFDLQADGTLASASTAGASCTQGKLAWFSPEEPTEHVLPVVPCDDHVRIAGDRIAAITRAGEERIVSLVALDGGGQTEAARIGDPRLQRGVHDFDGTRVAYAVANCLGGADLFVESAASPEPRPVQPSCSTSISSGSAPVGPGDRTVPVFVQCESGCAGPLVVRMRIGGRLRTVGERRVRIAPEDPCASPGTAFAVELSTAARRELRRRGRLNARVTVRVTDRTGSAREVSRTVRLRATRRDRPSANECSA